MLYSSRTHGSASLGGGRIKFLSECFREKCERFSRQEARQIKRLGSLRSSTRTRTTLVIASVSLGVLLQACSASREQGDGGASKLWGNDPAHRGTIARPPSAYDLDGPPPRTAEPAYRGGRDPVSGRADNWPPAAPPPVASRPPAPVPQYNSPPAAAYPQSAYAQPPASPYGYTSPAYRPAPVPAPAGPGSVEVRQGDTLYRIARAYNVTVPELMQANGLQNESIRPGQRIYIPTR